MQEIGGEEDVDLHPVQYDLDPSARVLKIDSPEALEAAIEESRQLGGGPYPEMPSFWKALAKKYDAVEIRNVLDTIDALMESDSDGRAAKFFRAECRSDRGD